MLICRLVKLKDIQIKQYILPNLDFMDVYFNQINNLLNNSDYKLLNY